MLESRSEMIRLLVESAPAAPIWPAAFHGHPVGCDDETGGAG